MNQSSTTRYLLKGNKSCLSFTYWLQYGGNTWDAVMCIDCTDYNVFSTYCHLRILEASSSFPQNLPTGAR
jgi:hypothetical protein